MNVDVLHCFQIFNQTTIEMKNIYDLELHESIEVECEDLNENTGQKLSCAWYIILRVPGGWLYTSKYNGTGTFVPFHREFDPNKKIP